MTVVKTVVIKTFNVVEMINVIDAVISHYRLIQTLTLAIIVDIINVIIVSINVISTN